MAFPAFEIFQNFPGEDPRTPLIKGIHQLNLQNLSSTTTAAKGKRKKSRKALPIKTIYKKFIFGLYRNWKKGELSPLKQSTRNLSLGYTEIGKRRRALGQDLFLWFVIGLFETLICAMAEDKVCDSCIVSSWTLLSFYFVCDDQIQISCAVWLRKVENLATTFCYLWLTEKLWLLGGTAPL